MEIAGDCGGGEFAAPPFVAKTYQMVSDPANDSIISWGRNKNSFVVLDPFGFCQTLLPLHFKHSNFSSFVRQLNTYGFRKVDPDRWEFAHPSFLRGQTQLLSRIARKRKERDAEIDEDDKALVMELRRLKEEQRAIEDKLERLSRRVRETERRPRKMLQFLLRVFEDPQMLGRLKGMAGIGEGEGEGEGEGFGWEKKERLRIDGEPPPQLPPLPPLPPWERVGFRSDLGVGGGGWGWDPFHADFL